MEYRINQLSPTPFLPFSGPQSIGHRFQRRHIRYIAGNELSNPLDKIVSLIELIKQALALLCAQGVACHITPFQFAIHQLGIEQHRAAIGFKANLAAKKRAVNSVKAASRG